MTTTVITHPQLVAALVKPAQDIIGTLSIFTMDCLHAAVGISGEAGELLEALLFPPSGQSALPDRVNVREELGDLFFYMEQLVQRTGVLINWGAADHMARNAIISPDQIIPVGAGLAVHASQVLDSVKKAAIYNKQLDLELVTNQMSALAASALTICYMFGIDKGSALTANIAKLSKRYESLNYSDQAAHARADKVQPQEGVIPERKYFRGDVPELPAETTAVTQPHVPRTSDMQDQVDAERGA